MDIVFNCPHCSLEIEVDQEASGQEFDCPTCQKTLTVPDAQVPTAQPVDAQPVVPPSPMAAQTSPAPPSSVPSLGEKRMVVPVSPKSVESLIQKPNKSLDLAAKESKPGMRVKPSGIPTARRWERTSSMSQYRTSSTVSVIRTS